MPPKNDSNDQSEIMKCLGILMGRMESLDKNSTRTTYALIGVIAAQIGVKVLGSDPLLDIATALAMVGASLLLGCLIWGLRLNKRRHLTRAGLWLVVMVGCLIITQIGVYLRDLGALDARVIYGLRILQNFTIIVFAWHLMRNSQIFQLNKDGTKAPEDEDK